MLPEIPREEFSAAVDACAVEVLWEAGIDQPPVDAVVVAQRVGLVVAKDDTMPYRGRFVRLAEQTGDSAGHGTIVVGQAERPERLQWAIAHEIGESVAERVFAALGISATAAPSDARELVANHLASRLLLPYEWFVDAGRRLDWDLAALKQQFATSSHELVARRMLEMSPPIVITLWDLGNVRWRRCNASPRPPKLLIEESRVWKESHESGLPAAAVVDPSETGLERVRCWPIHQVGWKREISRSEIADW
jgi:Zn-dependent peptidase ImmA (M78 family)